MVRTLLSLPGGLVLIPAPGPESHMMWPKQRQTKKDSTTQEHSLINVNDICYCFNLHLLDYHFSTCLFTLSS